MPINNEIIAELQPRQGIRAEIDKIYLYNPDAAGIHVLHDDTLKGKGTSADPLGISDEIKEQIENAGKIDDVQLNGVSVVVDKIANIEPDAGDIAYTNVQYPEMRNLQDAMDKLLYIDPKVSISGGDDYEIGSTRASTTLTWRWNKNPVSQSLNQGIGSLDPSIRTYTYNTPISTNTTFTISGTDGTNPASDSTSVRFLPSRYWGVSTKTSLTDAEILTLSSQLSTSRQQTRTFDCSGGRYIYFAIKTSYCNGIKFKVGGLDYSDMIVETRQFTNASGHTDTYNIYRTGNSTSGSSVQVEVL